MAYRFTYDCWLDDGVTSSYPSRTITISSEPADSLARTKAKHILAQRDRKTYGQNHNRQYKLQLVNTTHPYTQTQATP